ncbi:MAG: substrate-binding domain-containing protein [Candidatus Thermoplasmatota archaeon]|nr:substrate-binding domain-containing protein [Candidatus Thermoplasmatota archaeon]
MNTKTIGKRLVKNAQAVSPIIATLMLVLVAVGSAGAFYVWQSGWQSDVQTKTGGAGELQAAMTIGGSTTVYPFTAVAAQFFEAQNPNYKISFQQGGTGAGVTAVGYGTIDIGSASSRSDVEAKMTSLPDLNRDGKKDIGIDLFTTLIAYDAVVIAVPYANTHGLTSIHAMTVRDVYAYNGREGTATWDQLSTNWKSNQTDGVRDRDANGYISWDEVPTKNIRTDMFDNCTGSEEVKIYDRSEVSGTEETFCSMINEGKVDLESRGIAAIHATGNAELIQAISKDADALGFISYGAVATSTGLVTMIPYAGRTVKTLIDPNDTNFAKNIRSGVTTFYDGARELLYVTVGKPKGDAKVYIDFVLGPEMNKKICEQSGYISLY